MAVLLLAEINDGALAMDATAKAVSGAKALGDVTVLAVGAKAKDAAAEAAKIDGVKAVLVAEDALYGHRLAEPTAALIVSLAGDYSHIVAPATTDAKNIMPRVAALLDVMILTDVTGVVDADTFERPIYAGNAIQTVKSKDAKKVITFRTSTFDAAGDGGSASVSDAATAEDPGLRVNSHFFETERGVVLVDTQLHLPYAEEVLEQIRSTTSGNLLYIVTTHAHPDHWYGNTIFRRAFPNVPIITCRSVSDEIQATALPRRERWDRLFADRIPKAEDLVFPDCVF